MRAPYLRSDGSPTGCPVVARYANVVDRETGRVRVMRIPKWWYEKTMLAEALFGWLRGSL